MSLFALTELRGPSVEATDRLLRELVQERFALELSPVSNFGVPMIFQWD
jgi:hypothetical protein